MGPFLIDIEFQEITIKMQALLCCTVLLALGCVANGQVTGFGSCPKVPTQKTMDVQKYLGLWYEIERFPSFFEGDNCGTANYTVKANGNITVDNRYIENGVEHNALGEAYQQDPANDPAYLGVSFFNAGPVGDYRVVETDYNMYSLVYSCRSIAGLLYGQFAWILARVPQPDPAIVARLKDLLSSYSVDISHFEAINQTGCPVRHGPAGLGPQTHIG